jgi:salicylate hydroxylase
MGDIQQNGPGGQEHDGPKPRLDVAIVGGGIIGVITALGFLHRGMHVVIYERAAKFQEIGAAIAFTGVARECMQRLNPRVLEVLGQVGQKSPHEKVRYWDGFHPRTKQSAEQEESSLLFDVPERDLAFWACLRSHFLGGMADQLPEGTVQFGKQLVSYTDGDGSDKVVLRFADGRTAEADVGSFFVSHSMYSIISNMLC